MIFFAKNKEHTISSNELHTNKTKRFCFFHIRCSFVALIVFFSIFIPRRTTKYA